MHWVIRAICRSDEVHKVVVARDALKNFVAVDGWPTEHIPSRIAQGEQVFARVLAAARKG